MVETTGAFGFHAKENGVAELVHGAFGRLDVIADVCVRPCKEGGCRGACNKSGPNSVFDFLTGRLVECNDTKSLFGMALCVADSRKRDRFDLVGNFLDRNPLEDFVVRGRELLDSVIVDAFVGERDDCRVAVLRGEPEFPSRCALA